MQERYKDKYRSGSLRLEDYDYRTSGWYFITICVKEKECLFGRIKNGIVGLSHIGIIAYRNWRAIPDHFNHVQLDEFVIIPNHMHGILGIKSMSKPKRRDVGSNVSTNPIRNQRMSEISPEAGSLGTIIRSYKGSVTQWCTKNDFEDFSWQSNYYEHIIRNRKSLNRIREYIYRNPVRWGEDDSYIPPMN